MIKLSTHHFTLRSSRTMSWHFVVRESTKSTFGRPWRQILRRPEHNQRLIIDQNRLFPIYLVSESCRLTQLEIQSYLKKDK